MKTHMHNHNEVLEWFIMLVNIQNSQQPCTEAVGLAQPTQSLPESRKRVPHFASVSQSLVKVLQQNSWVRIALELDLKLVVVHLLYMMLQWKG